MIDQRVKITIVCKDAKDKVSFTRAWLPLGTSLAAAQSAAAALVGRIRPLSDARVYQISVSYSLKGEDIIVPRTNIPPSTMAVFSFELASDPTAYTTFITPLDPTWVLDSGPLAGVGIDLANAEVIELTDAITDGDWVDPFGEDIGAIYSASVSQEG